MTPADRAEKLLINENIEIPNSELEFTGVRSQGPGGQNVNKVNTAIQLKFDAASSSALPEAVKDALLALSDRRISKSGIITIKAQRSRSQDKNRSDALNRLKKLVLRAATVKKKRIPTKPSKKARRKRLEDKSHRSRLKSLRRAERE